MTRKELIRAIYENTQEWSCPENTKCERLTKENWETCCINCAEEQLADYERKIIIAAYNELSNETLTLGNKKWHRYKEDETNIKKPDFHDGAKLCTTAQTNLSERFLEGMRQQDIEKFMEEVEELREELRMI